VLETLTQKENEVIPRNLYWTMKNSAKEENIGFEGQLTWNKMGFF